MLVTQLSVTESLTNATVVGRSVGSVTVQRTIEALRGDALGFPEESLIEPRVAKASRYVRTDLPKPGAEVCLGKRSNRCPRDDRTFVFDDDHVSCIARGNRGSELKLQGARAWPNRDGVCDRVSIDCDHRFNVKLMGGSDSDCRWLLKIRSLARRQSVVWFLHCFLDLELSKGEP